MWPSGRTALSVIVTEVIRASGLEGFPSLDYYVIGLPRDIDYTYMASHEHATEHNPPKQTVMHVHQGGYHALEDIRALNRTTGSRLS